MGAFDQVIKDQDTGVGKDSGDHSRRGAQHEWEGPRLDVADRIHRVVEKAVRTVPAGSARARRDEEILPYPGRCERQRVGLSVQTSSTLRPETLFYFLERSTMVLASFEKSQDDRLSQAKAEALASAFPALNRPFGAVAVALHVTDDPGLQLVWTK